MELFLTLVFSAAFVGILWHAARWAFHMDRTDQSTRSPRNPRLSRKARARLYARFEEIVDDLRKDTQ